jgi:ADP-ribose pyrophosphatase
MKWKVLESKHLFRQPWLNIRQEKCELPNGKQMDAYYILEYPSWVNAFAITKDNKVVMVKQYRHALGEIGIELPGGVVDDGESPEEAISRELLEETGYSFDSVEMIGKLAANPATANNYTYFFLARGGEQVAIQKLDETEDIEIVVFTMEEVKGLVRQQKISQALHTSCIFYAFEKLGLINY